MTQPFRARRRLAFGAASLAVAGATVSLWLPWWWVDVEIAVSTSTIFGRALPEVAARTALGGELGIEAPSAWAVLTLAGVGAVAAVVGSRGAGRTVTLAALLAGLGTLGTAAIGAAEGDPTLEAMADRRVSQLTEGRVVGTGELAARIGSILGSDGFEASLHAGPRIGIVVGGGSGILIVAAGLIAATAWPRGREAAR